MVEFFSLQAKVFVFRVPLNIIVKGNLFVGVAVLLQSRLVCGISKIDGNGRAPQRTLPPKELTAPSGWEEIEGGKEPGPKIRQEVELLASDLQKAFPGMAGFSPLNVWRTRAFYLAWTEDLQKLSPPVTESEIKKLSRLVTEIPEEFAVLKSQIVISR
jgi:hypothetical protein